MYAALVIWPQVFFPAKGQFAPADQFPDGLASTCRRDISQICRFLGFVTGVYPSPDVGFRIVQNIYSLHRTYK